MKLSVVIPAYNEESRVGETLDKLADYLPSRPYEAEVVVVDDGSADRTREVVLARQGVVPNLRLVANDRNRGKGYTVRHGVSEARGGHILFYDADASTPIDQVEKFWPRFEEGYNICIGSRSLPDSDVVVHQSWARESMGRIFNLAVQTIAVRGIIDTQCGFKAFDAESARVVFAKQTLSGFGFDVELLYIGKKYGFRIAEVPVRWINSPASKVHPIKDALTMLMELFRIRYNDLTGAYR